MRTSHNYDAWNIKADDFPDNSSIEDQIKFLIGYGILAPSTHNTQPWKFRISDNKLYVYPDFDYRLKEGDPKGRNLFISLGCCVRNIECASADFGFETTISFARDLKGAECILILFKRNSKGHLKLTNLSQFITKRFSDKSMYKGGKIEAQNLHKLSKVVEKGVRVIIVDDRSKISEIAKLQAEAALSYANNKAFRMELSSWMRSNFTRREDGMPGFSLGLSEPKLHLGRFLLNFSSKIIEKHAAKDRLLIESSSAVGVVISQGSTSNSLVNVGRLFEHLALIATSSGLNLTVLAAIIENEDSLRRLAKIIGLENGLPQMFFRLGYGSFKIHHTPRRAIKKLIVSHAS